MSVFWSGTDMDTIKKLGEGGWFLSTVFNKKHEMRSAYYAVNGVYYSSPFEGEEGWHPRFLDELKTEVGAIASPESVEWDEEYEKNVIK